MWRIAGTSRAVSAHAVTMAAQVIIADLRDQGTAEPHQVRPGQPDNLSALSGTHGHAGHGISRHRQGSGLFARTAAQYSNGPR
jgi:hypothetical protein